ncbi:hypothetical protein CPC08DRAFT_730929 [Agrocybe pediades]|nr:hypothetical protein CPC08DRAFT_730929 [Agrocybe pediades]
MAEQSDYSDQSDAEQRPGPRPAPKEILHGDNNIWIQQELALLHQLLPEYIAKKKDEKSDFIHTTATSGIRQIWGDRYSKVAIKDPQVRAQWKKKKKQVRNWFINHSKGPSKGKHLGFKSTVTFSSVVDILHKDAVLRECDQLAQGAARGSPEWFKLYRKALQVVRQQLNDDEKQEALETMEKYKLVGYPKEYQATHAHRYGRAIIKKADVHRFKTMGMRSLTFECHYNDQGNIVFGMHDNSASLVNERQQFYPTFASFNRNAFSAFKEAYMDYVEKIFQWDTGKRADDLSFNTNDLGYDDKGLPLLPGEFLCDDVEPLKIKRDILRHYINKHYELASQGKTKAPWKEIQERPEQYYSLDSIPPDIRLQGPSHMSSSACTSLLKQWRSQQALGEVPFRFEYVKIDKELVAAAYPLGTFKAKSGKPAMTITSPLKKMRRRKRISNTTDEDTDGAPGHNNAGPPEADVTGSGLSESMPISGPPVNVHNVLGPSGPSIPNDLPPTPTSKKPSPLPQIRYLSAEHQVDDQMDPFLVNKDLPVKKRQQGQVKDSREKEHNDLMNSRAGNEQRRPKVRTKVKAVTQGKPLFLPALDGIPDCPDQLQKEPDTPDSKKPDAPESKQSDHPLQGSSGKPDAPDSKQSDHPLQGSSGDPDAAAVAEGRGHRIRRPKKADAYLLAQEKDEQYKLQKQRK